MSGARLQTHCGATAQDLAEGMAEVPDALQARLGAFLRAPNPDAAIPLARDLEGARLAVMRIRERLLIEGSAHVDP